MELAKTKTVKLKSSDGQVIEVDEDVVKQSTILKLLLFDFEDSSKTIPITSVRGVVLERVLERCRLHRKASSSDPAADATDEDLARYNTDDLFDLIMAANYLDIDWLLALGCKAVADRVKHRSAKEIRVILNIDNDFADTVEESQVERRHNWAEPSLLLRPKFDAISPEARPQTKFLSLPAEIRDMIYRQLLVCTHTIGYARVSFGGNRGWRPPDVCAVYTDILSTCRQISEECEPILYRSNTFGIEVWEKYGDERAVFLFYDHIARSGDTPVKEIASFEIVIKLQHQDEYWVIRSSIMMVCQALSNNPFLRSLKISLVPWHSRPSPFPVVLEPFTILRNVRHVEFFEVPPVYADYLQKVMTGRELSGHLPKMYQRLQKFAGDLETYDADLLLACEAMESFDIKAFKEVRSQIVAAMKEENPSTYSQSLKHLYDDDEHGEGDDEGKGVDNSKRGDDSEVQARGSGA